MNLDSHQHFWIYQPAEYPWIQNHMAVLRRDFLPDHLAAEQAKARFNGSIAVQARQTLAETRWLLELAQTHSFIKGVVGWVDLQSEGAFDQLSEFAAHPKFVGVRHVAQDEPDARFLLNDAFTRGLQLLSKFNLAYDLLVYPKQLPACIELARQMPQQRFVLDHIAKPLIRSGLIGPWGEYIRALASSPNVYCKISGLVTEASWPTWSQNDFSPFLQIACDAFGEDRLMVGSDWPVCLLAASYQQVIDIPRKFLASKSESAQRKIFGENAARFYRVKK